MSEKIDRRVRKTRAQLRAGLARLMQKKSIKEITVKELVDEIDINRSTFYLHYTDIYQMLKSIEDDLSHEIVTTMKEHPLDPMSTDGAYPFVIQLFTILEENKDICASLIGPNGDMVFVERIENLIADNILPDLFNKYPDDIQDIQYVFSFCIAGCVGLIKTWLSEDNSNSPNHMANLMQQMITNTVYGFIQKKSAS